MNKPLLKLSRCHFPSGRKYKSGAITPSMGMHWLLQEPLLQTVEYLPFNTKVIEGTASDSTTPQSEHLAFNSRLFLPDISVLRRILVDQQEPTKPGVHLGMK